MKKVVIACLFLTSFTPIKKQEYREIDILMHKIKLKAQNECIDKEVIVEWLNKQECLMK